MGLLLVIHVGLQPLDDSPCAAALADHPDHAAEDGREDDDAGIAAVGQRGGDEAVDRARESAERVPAEEDQGAAEDAQKERDQHVLEDQRQADGDQWRHHRQPTRENPQLELGGGSATRDAQLMAARRQVERGDRDFVLALSERQLGSAAGRGQHDGHRLTLGQPGDGDPEM